MRKKYFLKAVGFFLLAVSITNTSFAGNKLYFKGFYNGIHISGKIKDTDTQTTNKLEYNFGKGGGLTAGFKSGIFASELEWVTSDEVSLKNLKSSSASIFYQTKKNVIDLKNDITHDLKNKKEQGDAKNNPEKRKNEDLSDNQKKQILYYNNIDKFKYSAVIVNFYGFVPMWLIDVYGGIGAGITEISKSNGNTNAQFSKTFQAKVGITLNITSFLMPYVGYRLLYIPSTSSLNNSSIISHILHNLELGIMIAVGS